MVNVNIQNGNESVVIELPTDRYILHQKIWDIGIREKPENIKLTDADDSVYKVKLSSDSDFGNSILKLFNEDYSLDDVNACIYKLENTRLSILEDMEGDILHEQFASPEELMEELNKRTSELITVSVDYYCPLTIQMMDDDCADYFEVDNGYALSNEETIRERLMAEQNEDLNDMAYYFDGSETAKDKLVSAIWDVKEVNGTLYGVIHTHLTEKFTPEEEKAWVDELIGQAADGFGEGFEQREIKIDDGYICVSFWNGSDDYFMENQDDFENRMADDQNMGMQMGGM